MGCDDLCGCCYRLPGDVTLLRDDFHGTTRLGTDDRHQTSDNRPCKLRGLFIFFHQSLLRNCFGNDSAVQQLLQAKRVVQCCYGDGVVEINKRGFYFLAFHQGVADFIHERVGVLRIIKFRNAMKTVIADSRIDNDVVRQLWITVTAESDVM